MSVCYGNPSASGLGMIVFRQTVCSSSTNGTKQFKRTHLPVAIVVDEFGDAQGLVSLTDVTSSMDGNRVDRVLVTRAAGASPSPPVIRTPGA